MTVNAEPLRELILERLKFHATHSIPFQNAQVDILRAMNVDEFIVRIAWETAGVQQTIVDEKFPATWADAFRARWFPQWALKRWAVVWRYIRVNKLTVFPQITLPPSCGRFFVLTDVRDTRGTDET